mgnify:CR=1 FL=1
MTTMILCPWCLLRPVFPGAEFCQECILRIEWLRNVALQDRVAAMLGSKGHPAPTWQSLEPNAQPRSLPYPFWYTEIE